MTISLNVSVLPEPYLEFGDGSHHHQPRTGLLESGPFSLRYGNDIPGSVRLGFVGPAELIDNGHHWFERCQKGILAAKANRRRHADFPSFEEAFRAKLDTESRWSIELSQRQLAETLVKSADQQFQSLVDLYDDAVRTLAQRELGPNVIICSLPDELLSQFHTWKPGSRRNAKRKSIRVSQQQMKLFDDQDEPDDGPDNQALVRDFRRSLKAKAMKHNARIQLAHNHLYDDNIGDDPAIKAWDVCTACFYKAGGIPWRLAEGTPYTCFIGISFHHLRTEKHHIVYSSCAEAFSTETEGFVLRGDNVDWSRDNGKTPHLSEAQAFHLATTIVSEYRNRTGRAPIRIVLHKTSKFEDQERAGFTAGWDNVAQVEFITLGLDPPVRLLPRGDYPPRRGTLMNLNGSKYLYTTGFFEPWGSYPGPHIPRPIEVQDSSGRTQTERSCQEILGLTKMNFNSTTPFGASPITTKMAVEVGRIMAEVEEDRVPDPSYRSYM